jgi:hypothetical protein
LIVHIHFDAKYKIEQVTDIFGFDDDLDQEKLDHKKGLYKRADILKMHSYKDAIRRSAGAYVLYPGTESKMERGFHEIIPGLGAFPVKPSEYDDGSTQLKKFLQDVTNHFLNRTSQREKLYYQTYAIHNHLSKTLKENLPELLRENRDLIPDQTYVLIGYYKDTSHLDWIIKNSLYNARMDSRRGSLKLGIGESTARYLLLHGEGETKTGKLFKIVEKGPRVFSINQLKKFNYPHDSREEQNFYLVYKVDNSIEKELDGRVWDITQLEGYKPGRGSSLPFTATLAELMEVEVVSKLND